MNNPLLARFASVPSLVAPEMRERFEACLHAVTVHERAAEMLAETATAEDGFWPEPGSWKAALRPYVVCDGVLWIPVKGVLLHDFPYALGSYATGYIYIQRAFERGLGDPTVRAIALLCDSPGGEVAGNFDLVDRMHARRGEKPVRAFAHESAYSAAYSIASVADKVVVSRTGGVGSIGVVTAHLDASKMLDDIGLKVTFIFAGKHKVDGNPYEPLPGAVKERIQARIDSLYDVFVATVARNRGMDEQAVRDTEALTFTAAEAIANGLADGIGSIDDALAAFTADPGAPPADSDCAVRAGARAAGSSRGATRATPDHHEDSMAQNSGAERRGEEEGRMADTKEGRSGADAPGITKEAHEAAVATARAEGEKAGAAAATARVKAILGHEAAKGREELAQYFAFETDMSADAAAGALAKAPKATEPAPAGSRLAAEMRNEAQPNLGSGDQPGSSGQASDFEKGRASAAALLGKKL